MAKYFKPKIVSANDLFAGDVVYLDTKGGWTRDLRGAAVATTEDEATALESRAGQPGRVVGPALVDVTLDDDGLPFPSHFREKFRDRGPSTRPDLGRQAARPPCRAPLASPGGL